MRSKSKCSTTVGALLDRNGITVNESAKPAKILLDSVVQYLEENVAFFTGL